VGIGTPLCALWVVAHQTRHLEAGRAKRRDMDAAPMSSADDDHGRPGHARPGHEVSPGSPRCELALMPSITKSRIAALISSGPAKPRGNIQSLNITCVLNGKVTSTERLR